MRNKDKILVTLFFVFVTSCFSQDLSFSDTIMYVSNYNEVHFRDEILHGNEVHFQVKDSLIMTTMGDQMERMRIHSRISENEDSDHKWDTYHCVDNSGTHMYFTYGYDKASGTYMVTLDYSSALWYFEVEKRPIPDKPYDVMAEIESLGVFGDDNFGERDYTNEEIREILSQFGDPDLILFYIILSLFFTI